MKIDISLKNQTLYEGCEIEEVGGRLNLVTPPAKAANIIGRNINRILEGIDRREADTVILTGPMAVWAYLVVFHAVLHRFRQVIYDDGRNAPVVVAKHG